MVRIANENMANAVRIVTVEEGVDPRDHALIAMGGAGPTHAAEIAEAIGMGRVIVPLHPGVTSAFGALAAAVRVDEVKSVALKSPTVTPDDLQGLFAGIERRRRRASAPREAGTPSRRWRVRSQCATRVRTTSRRSRCPQARSRTTC